MDWGARFFAGGVAAELTNKEGETITRYVLDVSADPTKLGKDTFATMLRQFWKEDPLQVSGASLIAHQAKSIVRVFEGEGDIIPIGCVGKTENEGSATTWNGRSTAPCIRTLENAVAPGRRAIRKVKS